MQMLVKQHFARHTTELPGPVAFSTVQPQSQSQLRHKQKQKQK